MGIKFGTEGWRAIMAEEFTADNVRTVSQAIAAHLVEQAGREQRTAAVALGYDGRFLSDYFARCTAEVLAANRLQVTMADGPVPTCAVSRYVVAHQLLAGVMITASHNPPLYNGMKVKEHHGCSATPETVASIESRMTQTVHRIGLDEALRRGAVTTADLLPDYVTGLRKSLNLPAIRKSRFKVLVDPMYGVGDHIAERLVRGGRCRIATIHGEIDPRFGGQAPEPIPSHLTELSKTVKRGKWSIGLASDGDADRVGIVGPDGVFIPPGQILCLLLEHLIRTRKLTGAVITTVSNTAMITRMTSALGLKLIETPVGFKSIAKLMIEDQVIIGGEESGGIGVQGYLPERDGVFIGLLTLEAMAMQGKGIMEILHGLEKRYGRFYYARRDLTLSMDVVARFFDRLKQSPPSDIAGVPVREVKTLDGIKLIGKNDSWLLFRRSGTEPIVRVYAESPQAKHVQALLALGVRLIQQP